MRKTISAQLARLGVAGAVMLTCHVRAASPEDIVASIDRGVSWLVSQQNGDGSWGGYEPVAHTGLAVVKLEERAFELGYPSPFDDAYPEKQNVVAGLDYLFSQTGAYSDGTVSFSQGGNETYSTGIAMMAIAASRAPQRVVNVTGSAVDGQTYKQVLDACVGFFTWSQNPDGGWRYWANNQPSDNSNTGYAVLGLRYAQAPIYGFSCVIPNTIQTGLVNWITTIQDPVNGDADDGGSWYDTWSPWVNLLKTGNLLFEMSFVGDSTGTPRVQDAVDYIDRHWNDNNSDPGWRPHHYQSMYCLMKGLESLGIDSLSVGGNPINWYDEFADAIVVSQNSNGSWPDDRWGDSLLSTAWALLVLEKVAPPPPTDVQIDLPACGCDVAGYDVNIAVTVERVLVNGTLVLYEDDAEVETKNLENFTGVGNFLLSVAGDVPGTHTWKAVLDVTPTGGGTAAHAEDSAVIEVCETPLVGDIPDQVAPFQTIDLDDYLDSSGALPVSWTISGVPTDWAVTLDTDNVVTIAAPPGAQDPATLTFTATVNCCADVVCGSSDDATFVPNQPPDCSAALPSVDLIWPPNHKLVPVEVLGVTDPDGDPVTITIDAIFQDEPLDTYGDGTTVPDGDGVGSSTAWVRAERSGSKKVPGNGRVYHILFTADDGRGGQCEGQVAVGVPHDMKHGVVDDGPTYISTVQP